MHLSQINDITEHRIFGGSEYCWNCYPDARMLEYESDFAYVSVIYSTVTQEIYEAEVSVKAQNWDKEPKPYRWLNPEFKDGMIDESTQKNVDWSQAWDTISWVDLESEEDFLEKAKAIFNGEDFDERILVPVELDNDTIMALCMQAHKRDITLNELIQEILRNMLAKNERDAILGLG
jgi:hypothetical protein